MADLVVNTHLDADLKAIFNNGKRIDAVLVQLVRTVKGHVSDSELDDDLKQVYGLCTPEMKELACFLQILRIVEAAKNETPATDGGGTPNVVAAPSTAPTVTAAAEPAAPVTNG